MPARIYVMFDLVHADISEVARMLCRKSGVAVVDVLEGSPSIIMVIEAPGRLKAGEYLVDIMNSVEGMAENWRVLPVGKSVEKTCAEVGSTVGK